MFVRMVGISCLILTCKVPAEPSAERIAIWRRLKGMGAICLQNGACVLLRTDDHVCRPKLVGNDIGEARGEGVNLQTAAQDPREEAPLVSRFTPERDLAHAAFIDKHDGFEREVARETAAGRYRHAESEEDDGDLKTLQGGT